MSTDALIGFTIVERPVRYGAFMYPCGIIAPDGTVCRGAWYPRNLVTECARLNRAFEMGKRAAYMEDSQ